MKIESQFKYYFLIVFLFIFNSLFSQIKLNIIVKDTLNNRLQSANIILKKHESNKIVAFGVSNENGEFILDVEKNTNYLLKISFLGYKTLEVKIDNNNQKETLEIVLKVNKNELNEVIVKAKSNAIKQKGDTITYRVESFMNGTEETLKDIIKKLPGLSINDNGKITSNGKEVDKLLVDGEEFFDNQHQLATENLSSNMIKNVELLKNYKSFNKLVDNEKTGLTAVNINIKEEFKNKIVGNIDLSSGYRNNYKVHSSLFSFNKKTKISFISDVNNTGQLAISLDDYFSLTKNEEIKVESGENSVFFTNPEDIPNFLSSGNNVEKRKIYFNGINLVYNVSKKTKTYIYSITNLAQEDKNEIATQKIFSETNNIENIEKRELFEKSLFTHTKIETVIKPNNKTIYRILNSIDFSNFSNDNITENLINLENNIYNSSNKDIKSSFSNIFEFSKKINQNKNIKATVFLNNEKKSNEKNIYSNVPFLNLNFKNDFYINQFKNKKNQNFGFNTIYNLKIKKNSLKIYSNLNSLKESFYNQVENFSNFDNYIKLNTFDSSIGFDFTYRPFGKFIYTFGINQLYTSKNYFEKSFSKLYFLPKSIIKFNLNQKNSMQISYTYSNKFPTAESLIPNKIILDYRNTISNQNINFDNLLPSNQININYSNFDFPRFFFTSNLSFNFINQSITSNTYNTSIINEKYNILSPKSKNFTGMIFLEKTFLNLPYSISNSISISDSKKIIFISNEMNDYNTKSFDIYFKIFSRYKKFPINFETGFVYVRNNFQTDIQKSYLINKQFLININGKITDKMFFEINTNSNFQKTNSNKQSILNINPKIRYKINSNFNLSLIGNNILNIENPYQITNNSSEYFFEEKKFNSLPGYVIIEIKYKI